ncbi:hypothetical protein P154DRAFT_471463 [Amniculicola lignicola CBS 123094]|uniref:Heterokaryon incompatibility domain-containing protein n=1 Tax=Amniculicola lignicola CBS 123094 TaxID=1392246 RepID=A0A6A5WA98_9PLEO|nr:hypothetical protein P154DRAFT_471463 [Amniculicola lignicola CBS 123094]
MSAFLVLSMQCLFLSCVYFSKKECSKRTYQQSCDGCASEPFLLARKPTSSQTSTSNTEYELHDTILKMRPINCSMVQLEEFFGERIPPYAILFHTWGDTGTCWAQSQSLAVGYLT